MSADSSRTSPSLKGTDRYLDGSYRAPGDGECKAADIVALLSTVPNLPPLIRSYADVGCGDAKVFSAMLPELAHLGFELERACGFDVAPVPKEMEELPAYASIQQEDFLLGEDHFDLVSLIDVVEHVLDPVGFIKAIAPRSRFLLFHIPLDDRLSVLLSDQWNYRLQSVGHLSFWNPASALTMLTSAGVEPLACSFTGGFRYPSGRVRRVQRLVFPFRWLLWKLSPGFAAQTIGGVSLAVLCKGRDDGTTFDMDGCKN